MKKYAKFLSLITASVIALAGCGSSGDQEATAGQPAEQTAEQTKIKVGVTAGPHEQIIEKVKEVAKEKEGLDVEIVVFNDYVLPNKTLHEGEINANSFQTIPFLENFNEDHGANVVVIDKTVTFPMGIYSAKYKSIDEIPDGATVGIQNDPTQRARALFLYEQAGLIKLKADVKDPTPFDIAENPKNLEFKELEAAFLARALDDLAVASINTNFAMEAGYSPKEDSIFSEGSDSPYVNVIAANEKDKDNPAIQKLVNAYRSEEVKAFIEEEFNGAVLPSW